MRPIRFGLIGEYQSGKSLFVNCLLQRSVATVGGGCATTHTIVNYQYGENEYVKLLTTENKTSLLSINELYRLDTATDILVIDVFIKNSFLKDLILTDMPGFGANDTDNELARKVLPKIDFAILIASSDKSFGNDSDSFRSLRALKEYRIPYFFVLNCTKIERWRCDDKGNFEIANHDVNMLSFYPPERYPLNENGLNIINLMWYWYSICKEDDELINRKANERALTEYNIGPTIKKQLQEASNFNLIKILFNMEHREYLELKCYFKEEINILRRELCPIGTIQAFAFESIPMGWLPCDGRAVKQKDYPQLYQAIGAAFGNEENDSFYIPDLRGRFIRGWDKECIRDETREFGSSQDDSIQRHAHKFKETLLVTSKKGRHTHRSYCYQYDTVKDVSGWGVGSIEMGKRMGYPTREMGLGCIEVTPLAGEHEHSILKLGEPVSNEFTSMKMKGSQETRPKNLSLSYCIKAL